MLRRARHVARRVAIDGLPVDRQIDADWTRVGGLECLESCSSVLAASCARADASGLSLRSSVAGRCRLMSAGVGRCHVGWRQPACRHGALHTECRGVSSDLSEVISARGSNRSCERRLDSQNPPVRKDGSLCPCRCRGLAYFNSQEVEQLVLARQLDPIPLAVGHCT